MEVKNPPVFIHLFLYEAVFFSSTLLPTTKILIGQSVTKQELPKNHTQQNLLYQKSFFKKEKNYMTKLTH